MEAVMQASRFHLSSKLLSNQAVKRLSGQAGFTLPGEDFKHSSGNADKQVLLALA
jgi:hypothetical protein